MKGQSTIDVQRRWGNTYIVYRALSGVWSDLSFELNLVLRTTLDETPLLHVFNETY